MPENTDENSTPFPNSEDQIKPVETSAQPETLDVEKAKTHVGVVLYDTYKRMQTSYKLALISERNPHLGSSRYYNDIANNLKRLIYNSQGIILKYSLVSGIPEEIDYSASYPLETLASDFSKLVNGDLDQMIDMWNSPNAEIRRLVRENARAEYGLSDDEVQLLVRGKQELAPLGNYPTGEGIKNPDTTRPERIELRVDEAKAYFKKINQQS
ncbi:MAG: hypothetical protein ABIO02_00345 [Patescibacteria group bacterium]